MRYRDRLLTARQAAEMLGDSYKNFINHYMEYVEIGIVPVRLTPNGRPRFRESEILAAMDNGAVIKSRARKPYGQGRGASHPRDYILPR